MNKRKLWVSVSGGRTSAFMAIKLKFANAFDLKFVYANTGMEHEETLLFLDRIDKTYKLNIVWLEAKVHPQKGKSSTHTVTNFRDACRDARLFNEMVDKYGIPNQAYPHCTRELKINPMQSYIKSIGWSTEFRAIGIRADETRRISVKAGQNRILYPLIDFFPTDKEEVLDWFKLRDFDLKLPEHLGNCVTCWKKSDKKLLRIIREDPSAFDAFNKMEKEKGLCGANKTGVNKVFFRQNRSTEDLFKLSQALPEQDFTRPLDRCTTEECGITE